jgi:hypothetical protein
MENVKVYSKPNRFVETKIENIPAGRIVEIVDTGRDYHIKSYKLMGGDWRLFDMDYAPNYACAFLRAKKFAESGETSR